MQVIPVGVTDFAHFDQRVELDGVSYVLSFHWNQRQNLWTLDVGLPGADKAVAGVTVVGNRFLFSRYHYRDGVPPGELVALDPLFGYADGPGFEWDGFALYYFSAQEAVAFGAGGVMSS